MVRRFFTLTGIGAITLAVGVFGLASSAFAAATVESVQLTGPDAITVIYSQPVYTSPGDYSDLTGSYSGYSVTSVTGSGTSDVVLNLSGSPVPAGATGYLTIGTNVEDVSDSQYFPGGVWNIVDAVPPSITSFSMSSTGSGGTFAGTYDTVTIEFNFNEAVTVQSMTVAGHPVSPGGGGAGPYTVSYTMQSEDAAGSVPVTVNFSDASGNQGHAAFSFGGSGAGTANGPVIASIASNANSPGVLDIGNSITFTLTPSVEEPNGHVTGYYNGVPLSWGTANGGINYTATYVVASGEANQSVPLQLTGVTMTDQYGNVSAPASGSDVQKTINTAGTQSGPEITQITPVASTVTTATPSYTFFSNEAGSVEYGGGCTSSMTTASTGENTVTFNALSNGTYSSCTIALIDGSGQMSNTLGVPSFTVAVAGGTTTGTASSTITMEIQALQAQLAHLETQATSGGTTTSPASSYQFNNFLGVGSSGADVTALQQRLTADELYTGPITGYYGTLTEAAVEKYQAAHDIDVKGYVGPGTRAALNEGE